MKINPVVCLFVLSNRRKRKEIVEGPVRSSLFVCCNFVCVLLSILFRCNVGFLFTGLIWK